VRAGYRDSAANLTVADSKIFDLSALCQGDHCVATIADRNGVIPNGTRIPIPNQKLKRVAGT